MDVLLLDEDAAIPSGLSSPLTFDVDVEDCVEGTARADLYTLGREKFMVQYHARYYISGYIDKFMQGCSIPSGSGGQVFAIASAI